mmetsp:Transcript_4259/g.7753  ORF Transcript_4259/g.7753 Transcript_4259/m.7753 type:complete len:304 (-) Transcript_4259:105-1016(-)
MGLFIAKAKEAELEAGGEGEERSRAWPNRTHGRTLILFDVDGTLAVPAQPAPQEIVDMLAKLREHYAVGIVGAGDFAKQQDQLGGPDLRDRLDFCFSESGVHSFRGQQLLHSKSIADHLGKDRWAAFKSTLEQMLVDVRDEAEVLLRQASPCSSIADRGTFLEERQCTCNVCVIGRTPSLTKQERAAFEVADRGAGLRARLLKDLVTKFGPSTEYQLNFTIGGQIGIDCAPVGWDKTFCLQFVDKAEFDTIHFFGDKTSEGGGDYELFIHPRTIGHTVKDAADTIEQVRKLFSCDPALTPVTD